VVTLTIDPLTGLRLPEGEPGLVEHFYEEFLPDEATIGGDDPFSDFEELIKQPPAPIESGTPI
jgi:hypothetical protein